MGLKFKIENLDDLGDLLNKPLRDFYVEGEDGQFKLDVDNVVDASFRGNNITLMKENRKLKTQLETLTSELETASTELETLQNNQKTGQKVNPDTEQEMARLRERIKTLETEKTEITKRAGDLDSENYNLKARKEFDPIAKKMGLKDNPRVMDTAFQDFMKVMKFKDDKFVAVDDEGDPRVDDMGEPLTVDKFWQQYRQENEDWAFAVSTGSDSNPGRRTGNRNLGISLADLSDPSKMTLETMQDINSGKVRIGNS